MIIQYLENIPVDIVDYLTQFIDKSNILKLCYMSLKFDNRYCKNKNNMIWKFLLIRDDTRESFHNRFGFLPPSMNSILDQIYDKQNAKFNTILNTVFFDKGSNKPLKDRYFETVLLLDVNKYSDMIILWSDNELKNWLNTYRGGLTKDQIMKIIIRIIPTDKIDIFEFIIKDIISERDDLLDENGIIFSEILYNIFRKANDKRIHEMINMIIKIKVIDFTYIYDILKKQNVYPLTMISLLVRYGMPTDIKNDIVKSVLKLYIYQRIEIVDILFNNGATNIDEVFRDAVTTLQLPLAEHLLKYITSPSSKYNAYVTVSDAIYSYQQKTDNRTYLTVPYATYSYQNKTEDHTLETLIKLQNRLSTSI